SPPEICWHLIAPPWSTKVNGELKVCAWLGSFVAVLITGPVYGASAAFGLGVTTVPVPPVLVVPGWRMVAVGHWTLYEPPPCSTCAVASVGTRQASSTGSNTWFNLFMTGKPP